MRSVDEYIKAKESALQGEGVDSSSGKKLAALLEQQHDIGGDERMKRSGTQVLQWGRKFYSGNV